MRFRGQLKVSASPASLFVENVRSKVMTSRLAMTIEHTLSVIFQCVLERKKFHFKCDISDYFNLNVFETSAI